MAFGNYSNEGTCKGHEPQEIDKHREDLVEREEKKEVYDMKKKDEV